MDDRIMRGDAYGIPFTIYKEDDTLITPEMVADIEISCCGLIKKYSEDTITYLDGKWIFWLSQQDTFKAKRKGYPTIIRAKFNDGSVIGLRTEDMYIEHSESNEVL